MRTRDNFQIHSLISLGSIGVAMPFILKAYTFNLSQSELIQLCNSLESMVIRNRLIGTKANITSRLNDVYQEFSQRDSSIEPIVGRIDWMKNIPSNNWWWAYWNNENLNRALQGQISHSIGKYLLWRYENYLRSEGKDGYLPMRYTEVVKPHLEHIAPQTDNPESGYDTYDEEFVHEFLECLGNYLLLSGSHNCSVGNKPFEVKRDSFNHLEQQREIQKWTANDLRWTKKLIKLRKDKIISFLINIL